ncbi:MAG: hypothetical protein KGN79_04340 [Acidobacteriota bacterium]|nr:hypothetical protein [Acidobacteriota bacterium]
MFTGSSKFEFADRLALQLSVQLVMSPVPSAGRTKIEVERGSINKKALGYIYGFIAGGLRSRDQEITDYEVGLPILYHILQKLFPFHERAYMDFLMNHIADELVIVGIKAGRKDYKDLLHSGTPPFGLAQFILDDGA